MVSGSEVVNLQIKDIINEIRPVVINKKRTELDKQVILTTTLKHEEIGKYDDLPDVNHINYQSHTPSKILDGAFVESFVALLNDLSIEI